jgi:uncharacterized protein
VGELIRRRLGTIIVLGVLLVLFSANRVAVLVTDWWWFSERGFSQVFTTRLSTQVLLAVGFGVLVAALVAVNLMIARRLRPFYVPSSPQQAQIQRYREMADPYLPWIIGAVAVLFGFTSGMAMSANWDTFLQWRHAVPVGQTDPIFNTDLGYYLFRLPFWELVQTWLFTTLILTTALTAGAHYLLGGIRPEAEEKVLPSVKAHLAVLLAALLAVHAWGYWLSRYALNYSERGWVTTGASYTDVNAHLPALYLLIGVTVLAIVLVLVSIRRGGFLLPGAAIGLLVVAMILLQGAYPAAVQRLRVDPSELPREREFIEHHLAATRAAYGLDDVESGTFTVTNRLTEDEVIDNEVTLRNVRLWDPSVLETTYQQLQALRPFYQFNNVAIDRYAINGELRQVMLATRELSRLPEDRDTWQNRHVFFTHGVGVVASQVNTANPEGQPVFLSRDIPPRGEASEVVPEDQAGIYFGEFNEPVFSLVRTSEPELDFEDPEGNQQFTGGYEGNGGVPISGPLRRLLFALRFNDYNLVLTTFIQDDSRIIFNRNVSDRVRAVAPFLTLDSEPYPVVSNGRVVWIVDAYTTSNFYPYSERGVLEAGGQRVPLNYIRNSVKAVVDAFDGDVTLYRVVEDDPVLDVWERIFPGIITPMDEAPEGIAANFRYPQDLFWLQAQLYRTYHIVGAGPFYDGGDAWDIPRDPAAAINQRGELVAGAGGPLRPAYLLMRPPGAETEEFVLIQPYLARGRENMVAWLAGRSDDENLGSLLAVRFPTDQLVLGPPQAQARIEQDPEISAWITLRERDDSRVIRGNLQVLPIADSLLYVEPLFLQADAARIPELAQVALVLGERTAFAPTFAGALGELLGIEVPEAIVAEEATPIDVDREEVEAPPDEEEAPPPDVPDDTNALLAEALAAFGRAEAALRAGDLAAYQREIGRARDLIEQYIREQGIPLEDVGDDDGTDT